MTLCVYGKPTMYDDGSAVLTRALKEKGPITLTDLKTHLAETHNFKWSEYLQSAFDYCLQCGKIVETGNGLYGVPEKSTPPQNDGVNDNVQRLIDLAGKTTTSGKERPVDIELRRGDNGHVDMRVEMAGVSAIELHLDAETATKLALSLLRIANKVKP